MISKTLLFCLIVHASKFSHAAFANIEHDIDRAVKEGAEILKDISDLAKLFDLDELSNEAEIAADGYLLAKRNKKSQIWIANMIEANKAVIEAAEEAFKSLGDYPEDIYNYIVDEEQDVTNTNYRSQIKTPPVFFPRIQTDNDVETKDSKQIYVKESRAGKGFFKWPGKSQKDISNQGTLADRRTFGHRFTTVEREGKGFKVGQSSDEEVSNDIKDTETRTVRERLHDDDDDDDNDDVSIENKDITERKTLHEKLQLHDDLSLEEEIANILLSL